MRSILPLCVAILLAQTQSPQPQTPQPQTPQPPITFKSEVNYVEIDARVTDAQGNFVRDLSRDDFQIVEDGHPQTLTAFSMVDIPIERPDPPLFAKTAIPPDVVSNHTPFEGRIFVLVMDDLNTKFSDTSRTRAAARQFVERYVGSNDMVAVVNTSGINKTMQDFTSNRQLVLKAIDAAMGNKAASSTAARLQDYNQSQGSRAGGASTMNANFNDMMRWNNARNSMRTLKNIADYMAGMRGRRKAVVYFSEGVNYDVVDSINNAHATDVRHEMQDVVAAATRGNVNVYSVDPRGLVTGMEDAIELGSFPADNSISPTDLTAEVRLEQDSLRVLSDDTGGFAVLNQNDFRNAFDRILQDNSSYYVLGYYPTNDKRDGRFRNVDVKVLKPGVTVRSRKGYVAPAPGKKTAVASDKPGTTSPELRDALDGPIAVSGLTLQAFPVALRGAGGKDAIVMAIEVNGREVTFASAADGLFHADIELTSFATDINGKVKDGTHDEFKLNLKPQTHALVRASGFRVVRRIQVPPGRYQLRIGAREAGGGRVGTVIFDLDAPDFSKAPLAMSGIAIASGSMSVIPTTSPDPNVTEFKDVLPSPPTALRDFPHNDTLAIFAEVYDNIGKTPHRVEITTTILADDGHEVKKFEDERRSDELRGPGGGYGYSTQFPLTGIAPGRYVLRVAARSTLGNGDPVSRDVEFRVR
jgi:VWFA-related protein